MAPASDAVNRRTVLRFAAIRVLTDGITSTIGFTETELDEISEMVSAVRSWQASHAQELADRARVLDLFGPALAYNATDNHPTYEPGVF